MLRRCNEWGPVSGDPGNLRGLYSCLQDEGFKVVKIIQYNYQQNIKNELVRVVRICFSIGFKY